MRERFTIVGLGEVLWDLLPVGRQLGGAPANFTCHARALGGNARLVSRVGADDLGREAVARLSALGVRTDTLAVSPQHPTGTVSVTVESGQPQYLIHEEVAWDFIEATPPAFDVMRAADAVCFGTLAQRSPTSRVALRALLAATSSATLRICDVNLRQQFYSDEILAASLELANVLKVNDAELPRLVEQFHLSGDTLAQLAELARRFDLRVVAYTRGRHGSLLYSQGCWSDHPGVPTHVVDTIGAGDAFTAAMALGLLSGWDLDSVNEHSNQVAAYVCSRAGGMPPLPAEVCEPFLAGFENRRSQRESARTGFKSGQEAPESIQS